MSKQTRNQLIYGIILLIMVIALSGATIKIAVENQCLKTELEEVKEELEEKEAESLKFGIDMIMNNCPDCGSQTEIHTIDNKLYYMECKSCSLFCGFYMYLSEDAYLER